MNVYDEPTEVRVNLTRPLSGPHHWVLDLPSQSVIVPERRVGDRYASVSPQMGADPVTFPQVGRVVSAEELLRLPTA